MVWADVAVPETEYVTWPSPGHLWNEIDPLTSAPCWVSATLHRKGAAGLSQVPALCQAPAKLVIGAVVGVAVGVAVGALVGVAVAVGVFVGAVVAVAVGVAAGAVVGAVVAGGRVAVAVAGAVVAGLGLAPAVAVAAVSDAAGDGLAAGDPARVGTAVAVAAVGDAAAVGVLSPPAGLSSSSSWKANVAHQPARMATATMPAPIAP